MEFTKTAPKEKFVPNPKARLRDQLREVMRFQHYSARTEATYWQWIRRFLEFHRFNPPATPPPGLTPTEAEPASPAPNPLPLRSGEMGALARGIYTHVMQQPGLGGAQSAGWVRAKDGRVDEWMSG